MNWRWQETVRREIWTGVTTFAGDASGAGRATCDGRVRVLSYAAKDPQLLNLVDDHAESIAAVLSGHLHLTGVVVRNGVHHISLSGTASYPCDFATFDVFPDRIHLRVHSLPQELQTPDTNIHGRRRHKVDYTDATHSTAESYVRGNPEERNVVISL